MSNVRLYGAKRCVKSRLYEAALIERGVPYTFFDVEINDEAANELRLLYADRDLQYPTFLIGGKRVRNPSLRELDRTLTHEGLYDAGVAHEPKSKRFVRYMKPQDAFVSYSESETKIILGHIEIPPEKRGSGLGARLALEVFPMVKDLGKEARITCTFMRKVAASRPEWAEYFNIASKS